MSVIHSPETRKEFKSLIENNPSYLIIVKAYAEWCNPCKIISNYVFDKFQNIQIENKILILLDIDNQKDVSSYLKIRALPTLISYKEGMKDNIVEGVNKEKIDYFFEKCR